MKEIENYLDTAGACKELGISIATLYRLLKKRKKNGVPAHRLGGNWKFIKEELSEWIVSCKWIQFPPLDMFCKE